MKKLLSVFAVVFILISLSVITAYAEDGAYNADSEISYDFSGVYNSLSDEVKQSLSNIGVSDAGVDGLSNLSLEGILSEITNIASQNVASPLKGLISIIALLLLCLILTAYKNTLSNDISNAINIVSALCIVTAVAFPAINVINNVSSVVEISANLMLAYIPIIVAIMAASGQAISSGSYYSAMILAGEGVGQLSSKILIPFLNIFLGISITSSITPDVNLSGFTNIISKTVKWLLGFAMAVFSAFLSFKQIISNALDNVSGRAVRFVITSFVPVVGSALSDAYRTVQGSLSMLKSGLGVFVIIAVCFVFLPSILQCLMWIITLWFGKAFADMLNLPQPAQLLQNLSTVFSTILAILLCIMSIYIISSALVLMLGGGAN